MTLRGTDGLESGTGVMPLVYLTDFGGAMARSVPDLADMLNVVVATDPADPETSAPGRHVPADWRAVLDPNALRGKRIGFIASRWVDPFGTTNAVQIEQQRALQFLTAAGATIVQMGTPFGSDTPPAPASPTTQYPGRGVAALHRQPSRVDGAGVHHLHGRRRAVLAAEGRLRPGRSDRLHRTGAAAAV